MGVLQWSTRTCSKRKTGLKKTKIDCSLCTWKIQRKFYFSRTRRRLTPVATFLDRLPQCPQPTVAGRRVRRISPFRFRNFAFHFALFRPNCRRRSRPGLKNLFAFKRRRKRSLFGSFWSARNAIERAAAWAERAVRMDSAETRCTHAGWRASRTITLLLYDYWSQKMFFLVPAVHVTRRVVKFRSNPRTGDLSACLFFIRRPSFAR